MRLCANKDGDRQDSTVDGLIVHDINVLRVIARDSYADFVKGLQSEIKAELYDYPTKTAKEHFIGKALKYTAGASATT